MKYQGGCHCRAVRFEIEAPEKMIVTQCNCSICSKSGHLHHVVDKEAFTLLQGETQLSTYTFGTGVAQHHFCKICGIKSFYVPRSNPQGFSINVRCLDNPPSYSINTFDGQHWEDNIHQLRNET